MHVVWLELQTERDTDAFAAEECEAQRGWDAQLVGEWVEVELESMPIEVKAVLFPLSYFVSRSKSVENHDFFKTSECTVIDYERSNLMHLIEHQSETGLVKPQSLGQIQPLPVFIEHSPEAHVFILSMAAFVLQLNNCDSDCVTH